MKLPEMPRSHTAKLTVIISAGLNFFFRFEDIKITYPFPRVERIPIIKKKKKKNKGRVLLKNSNIPSSLWNSLVFSAYLFSPKARYFTLKHDHLILIVQLVETSTADISHPQQMLFSSLQQDIAFTTWACKAIEWMYIKEIP